MPAVDRDELARFIEATFRHADAGSTAILRLFAEGSNEVTATVRVALDGEDLEPVIDHAFRHATKAARASRPALLAAPVATFEGRRAPARSGPRGTEALVPIPFETPPGSWTLGVELRMRRRVQHKLDFLARQRLHTNKVPPGPRCHLGHRHLRLTPPRAAQAEPRPHRPARQAAPTHDRRGRSRSPCLDNPRGSAIPADHDRQDTPTGSAPAGRSP